MSNDDSKKVRDQPGIRGAKAPWIPVRLWLAAVVVMVVVVAVALVVRDDGSDTPDEVGAASVYPSQVADDVTSSDGDSTDNASSVDSPTAPPEVAGAESPTTPAVSVSEAEQPYFPTEGNVPRSSPTTTFWPTGYVGVATTTSVTLPQPGPQPTTTTTEPQPPPPPPPLATTSTTTTEPQPPPPPPTTTTTEPQPPPPVP